MNNSLLINSILAGPSATAGLADNDTPEYISALTTNLGSFYTNDKMQTMPINIVPNSGNFITVVDSSGSPMDIKKPLIKDETIDHYKNDYVAQFYIGSLTIVGLFILYRVIVKPQ